MTTIRSNVNFNFRQYTTIFSHCFTDLSDYDKKLCVDRILELEAILEDISRNTNLESFDPANSLAAQAEYLKSSLRLANLRLEFKTVINFAASISRKTDIEEFVKLYELRIINPCQQNLIDSQRKKGAEIGEMSIGKRSHQEFERSQIQALEQYLLFEYTRSVARALRILFDRLVDERTDSLFNYSESILVPGSDFNQMNAFLMSHADHQAKSELFSSFLSDLQAIGSKPNLIQIGKEMKLEGDITKKDAKAEMIEVDCRQYFICPKPTMVELLLKMSRELLRWQQARFSQLEKFYSNMVKNLLLELKIRENKIFELKESASILQENYRRDVRLGAAIKASDILRELAVQNSELSELKRSRRIEEKTIRLKVRGEYDELVQELSSQLHKLKARFHEYQLSTVEESLNAISAIKKENFETFLNGDYPNETRKTAKALLNQLEIIDELRNDNNDLKQVLSKIKSLYTLKDTTLKSAFSKKIVKLIEDKRSAEQKLWDSYRDSDAREKISKKNLLQAQKDLVALEIKLENVTNQLKEEQKNRVNFIKQTMIADPLLDRPNSASNNSFRVESFTRFEYERILLELQDKNQTILELQARISDLELVSKTESRPTTEKRLSISSRVSSPRRASQATSAEHEELEKLKEENNRLKQYIYEMSRGYENKKSTGSKQESPRMNFVTNRNSSNSSNTNIQFPHFDKTSPNSRESSVKNKSSTRIKIPELDSVHSRSTSADVHKHIPSVLRAARPYPAKK